MPERRWELSAPESGVLLWGPETRNGEALKLALLELVVRKALRLVSVEERRFFIRTKHTNVLTPGGRHDRPMTRSLQAVMEVQPKLRSYGEGTFGAPVKEWARAVFNRYRQRGGYVQSEVLPALEQRQLVAKERYKRLGLFEATRWVFTPAGTSALTELRALMETGRQMFGWHDTRFGERWVEPDPAQVRAFAEAAGAALLLLTGQFPEIRRQLGRASDRPTADGGNGGGGVSTVLVFPSDGQRPEGEGQTDQPEHLDPDADHLDFDDLAENLGPGPLDGIDAAYDAIADAVDSDGGDGGGDGDGGE